MLKLRFIFSVICLCLALTVNALAQTGSTVVILVRHAEKVVPDPAQANKMVLDANDPPLTVAGAQRANELGRILADVNVAAIYSTQYKRTLATVQPLADKLGLSVTVKQIDKDTAATHPVTVAKEITSQYAGKTVVVTGHSNTIPAIVEALSGVKIAPFVEATEYDRFITVIIPPQGKAQVIQSRYGRATN